MSVESLIKERRSIRKFADRDVPKPFLYKLFHQSAGLCDPQMLKSMRLMVALRRESKERLSRYMMDALSGTRMGKLVPRPLKDTMGKYFSEVPGLLVVTVENHGSKEQRENQYAQVCFFLQNLQLVAWEQQLGMFWRTDEMLYTKPFLDQLGVTDRERLVGILFFGFIDKVPRPRKRTPAAKRWRCWPQIE